MHDMHDEQVSRRAFATSAVGTVVALGAASGLTQACARLPTAASMQPPPPLPESRRVELSGADFSTWRDIDHLARLAPTPHNTQPYRIRPLDPRTADIVALGERFLPEEDHGNRYVASAFGILSSAIEMAARTLGVQVTTTPASSVDVAGLHRAAAPTTLGRVTVVGVTEPSRDASLLDVRRTSRIPYHDRIVEPEIWRGLQGIAATYGHRLLEYHDRDVVDATLRLNVDALIDNLGLHREREEIRHWYRTGPTPPFGDGLWEKPLNQRAIEIKTAFGSPGFFRLPVIRPIATHQYLKTQRGTRHVALLCGRFTTWPDLVGAGRALFDVWIEMARHGVYMHPMGSMLTNSVYATEIARRFGVTDCWLAMRVGYSDAPPRAPRLASILL
ncbi:hypothetical protein J421_5267 (plasmid) [Gemmatirosa kalamazoonensis]|uniref:Nitroreductase n=1 Tax=Gemmatirosa kalamazoonensis TaxID=861299 RepID=W0RQR9_9BACT|nr:hypothetical protein [Gemmatirosa kalamazoonensis]AHG92802.1 hypothetical protein J421_5267 [Gemmatirosa kalamazoonensis]